MPPRTARKPSQNSTVDVKKATSTSPTVVVASSPSSSKANGSVLSNSKATTVTDDNSSGYSTPVKQASDPKAFTPGSTPVKFAPSNEMQRKTKSTPRATPRPTSQGFSLRALAVRLALLYGLVAYLFVCPNDPSRLPHVCKSFNEVKAYRNQAISSITPYFQPYIDTVHERIDPYTTTYIRAAKPYYARAEKILTPQVAKGKLVYEKNIKPRLLDAVTHSHQRILPYYNTVSYEYQRTVGPHVDRYSRLFNEIYDINVKPRVDELSREFHKHARPLRAKSAKVIKPIIANAYPFTQHHLRHTVHPFVTKSYHTSTTTYSNHVHPRLVASYYALLEFIKTQVGPQFGRFNSKYISPQLSKIQDKAWAHKAKKIAEDKVVEMDGDLGRSDITDEIDGLLSEIKAAESASTLQCIPSSVHNDIEPTAIDDHSSPSDKPDPVSQKLAEEEARALLNAEKRKTTLALHDLYDLEIPKLGETELALLAERLASLRKSALRDIPVRFDTAVQSFEADCDKWVGRLEKYWEKALRDDRTSVDDKIADGSLIARKAGNKIAEQAEELEDELDSYSRTHNVREATSVEKAFKTIETFVGKAQDELGNSYAWLDDVTHQDWKRFHTLAAVEGSWHHQLFGLKNGSVSHPALPKGLEIEKPLSNIRDSVQKILAETEARIEAARVHGEKRAKGEFLGAADAIQSGYAAVQEKVAGAVSSASIAVAGTPTPTDLYGTVTSVYEESAASASSIGSEYYDAGASVLSVAAESAESLAAVASSQLKDVASTVSTYILPTDIAKALEDGSSSISSVVAEYYGSASQKAYLAVGATPSPTDARQSVESLLGKASSYLGDLQGDANSKFASYASEASKTALHFAGQTPAPTNVQESVASYATSLASEISSVASDLHVRAAKIGADALAALPNLPSQDDLPNLSELSSSIHSATREVYKTVGISVTPESFGEHVESAYSQAASVASSLSSEASQAIPTLAVPAAEDLSSSLHQATRSIQSAIGVTPSPEGVEEHVASAYHAATSTASSLLSEASGAVVPSASSLYEEAGSSASSALEAASSAIHQATRSAISAAGATPSPENLKEHAESVIASVSSAASSVIRERVEL